MNKIIFVPLIILVSVSLAFTIKNNNKQKSSGAYTTERGFALVELFTSEGCSSCPPADELIASVAKQTKAQPVYILAYHVDYWDRLGWKDAFSSPKFSARQNRYANWLKLKTIYTPQIVVNGSREFVGSESSTLQAALTQAATATRSGELHISLESENTNAIKISYHTTQSTQGYELTIARVSPAASHQILRGENKGRTLSHVQIVKQLQSISLLGKTQGSAVLEQPDLKAGENDEIIAFLQSSSTGKISAATRVRLNNL